MNQSKIITTGPLAWMAKNPVTANLMMLFFLIGGLVFAWHVKKEVFPDFTLDIVNIKISYPGATPEEIEKGTLLAIENQIQGLDGIAEIESTASENSGQVSIELTKDASALQLYQDIQQKVSTISTLPDGVEKVNVSLATKQKEVMTLQLYGPLNDWQLRQQAESIKTSLLNHAQITQVEISGARDYETQIEISAATLQKYKLTFQEIAKAIQTQREETTLGVIESAKGDVALQIKENKYWASEYGHIPVIKRQDGTIVLLNELATIKDSFESTNRAYTFNGKPSIAIEIYRIGDETPTDVANATREVIGQLDLPNQVEVTIVSDMSQTYRDRLELLLKNAFIGLLLVLVLLALFLEFKLAFWVTMGIPTAFLGAFIFLPALDLSLNMISMFAFIIALGIVVDDAVIAGENIFECRQKGMSLMASAVEGVKAVAVPLTFSILTNIFAFMPLYFLPGFLGKIFSTIPMVVTAVFLISWIEALLIMPAHLAHSKPSEKGIWKWLNMPRHWFDIKLNVFIHTIFQPVLKQALAYRYLSLCFGLSLMFIMLSYASSGRMGFSLMPRIESDKAVVTATLPYGAPEIQAEKVLTQLKNGLSKGIESIEADPFTTDDLIRGIETRITDTSVQVIVYETAADVRPISTGEFIQRWRSATGDVIGAESVRYQSDLGGPGGGAGLTLKLTHSDTEILETASAYLVNQLNGYADISDIKNEASKGRPQLNVTLTPAAQILGFDPQEIRTQVRSAFFGQKVLSQQRGDQEVDVMLSLPESEKNQLATFNHLMLKAPSGDYVPLIQLVKIDYGTSVDSISRVDGKRVVTVSANVKDQEKVNQLMATIEAEVLPEFSNKFPNISWSYGGRQADTKDSIQSLLMSFAVTLLILYATLAIPFKSYLQPLSVMLAIPFGIFGALLGHLLMGYSLSLISILGIIALSGIVVNDSLVMIVYANELRDKGNTALEAILGGAMRRFRPILLTTLSTFGGLAPMIFETSIQAKFLIPMAISLGYGILFATAITLILLPCLYLALDDLSQRFSSSHSNELLTKSNPTSITP
ncbi:efflux RND transporter permease subunit [Algicola sagamiensis]|uniref:efflux RND transporter permease subunit n=1 Tax=Algicola sagamiensis TaxID=163869 RepID=UPI00036ACD3B|nr:efflux RND transporter permease subunit [Algicola sagamiensis]